MTLAGQLSVLLLGLALAAPPAHAAPGSPGSWRWRRDELRRGVGSPAVTALALDSASGRIAVGGADGVTLIPSPHSEGESLRRFSRPAGVTDLHFASDGSLWIATLDRLWWLGANGRLEDRSPGTGEAARWIHRIASALGVTIVTTEAGAYVSRDARRWHRLARGMPLAPAGAVAMRARPSRGDASGVEVWLVSGRDLWRIEAHFAGDEVRSSHARVSPVAGLGAGEIPVDIALGLPGSDVVLVYAKALALLRNASAGSGARPADAAADTVQWQVVRPVMPSGARARRFAHAHDRFWLATDQGLVEARELSGPWQRAAPPAGQTAAFQVVGGRDAVRVATEWGLLVGAPVSEGVVDTAVQGRVPLRSPMTSDSSSLTTAGASAKDPDIGSVQRAALRYLGLGPPRLRALWRGLGRRGWLPELSLRVGGALERDYQDDYDEAFLSGATRSLHDHDINRGNALDALLSLSWELGDIAYPSDAVDLSREERQVISLRDDVLDQINQLYFERRGVLLALAATPPPAEAERRKLQLRAEELAAGLDGWTGGWFGAQVSGASRGTDSRSPLHPE